MNEPQAGPKGSLDLTKPVQTRDGYPVRIICTDATPDYPIVGVVGSESLHIRCWWGSGQSRRSSIEQDTDLINVPPPEVASYTRVYDHLGRVCIGALYDSDDGSRDINQVALLKIIRVDGKITKVELV
jgi:hypothetical protein